MNGAEAQSENMVERHSSHTNSATRHYNSGTGPVQKVVYCWHCGGRLSFDRDPGDRCSACGNDPYLPRFDPLFKERVLCLLMHYEGRWVEVTRLLGHDCSATRDAVFFWRRRGLVIDGRRGAGYRLQPFAHTEPSTDSHG